MKCLVFLSALIFVMVPIFSEYDCLGQIPQTINYQGILTDTDGEVVADNNYNLTFKLYDTGTNGTELWSESQTISVNDGIFNAILGSVNPLEIPFDEPYWLGITIGTGTELTPRIELTSSAYSLNSKGVIGTSNVFPDSGNVGIGTSTPAHLLSFPDGYGDKISLWGQVPGANCLGFGTQYREFQMYTDQSYADIVFGWGRSQSLSETMRIKGNGRVGIGTNNPQCILHLNSSGKNGIIIDGDNTQDIYLMMRNSSSSHWIFDDKSQNHKLTLESGSGCDLSFNTNGPTERMRITNSGNVGIGTIDPKGKLDVNGTIYQRGIQLHADYVFESGYKLESIESHAKYMWENKHLKAISKAMVDENGREIVEFGSHQRGIVEELEKAHIYIEQLHERIKNLEQKIEQLSATKPIE